MTHASAGVRPNISNTYIKLTISLLVMTTTSSRRCLRSYPRSWVCLYRWPTDAIRHRENKKEQGLCPALMVPRPPPGLVGPPGHAAVFFLVGDQALGLGLLFFLLCLTQSRKFSIMALGTVVRTAPNAGWDDRRCFTGPRWNHPFHLRPCSAWQPVAEGRSEHACERCARTPRRLLVLGSWPTKQLPRQGHKSAQRP